MSLNISKPLFRCRVMSAAELIMAMWFRGVGGSGMKSRPVIHVGWPWALWCLQHIWESNVTFLATNLMLTSWCHSQGIPGTMG